MSKATRNARIIAAYRKGEPAKSIAARHGLTAVRVRQIVKAKAPEVYAAHTREYGRIATEILPVRTIRVGDADWQRLGECAAARGLGRGPLVRGLIRAYLDTHH